MRKKTNVLTGIIGIVNTNWNNINRSEYKINQQTHSIAIDKFAISHTYIDKYELFQLQLPHQTPNPTITIHIQTEIMNLNNSKLKKKTQMEKISVLDEY